MSKKILTLSLFFLFTTSISQTLAQQSSSSGAQGGRIPDGNMPSTIIPPQPGINFLGQDHYYTVTFRGNGEAVVTAKVILTNTSDQPLSSINLRVPKVDPKDIVVYQVMREPQCIRYGQAQGRIFSPACLEYQEPDYYQYYGQAKYQKAKYEYKGDTLTISLPNEVKPDKSTSFILYFRDFGYAKKNIFGAFNFSFETLKVEDRIRNLQVGIEVDADEILRGAKGKVNYRFEEGMATLKMAPTAPIQNQQFDNFYQNIGQGSIVKNASNLQPLESYSVKGSYADSRLKLYGKEILVGILITLLVIVMAIVLMKAFLSRMKKAESKFVSFLESLGVSFLASFFILAYTIVIFLITRYLDTNLGLYQSNFLIMILLTIVSLGIYAILLIGPSLFMGLRKGWSFGLLTFVASIGWLMLYLVIVFIILALRQEPVELLPTMPLIKQY